MFSGLYQHTIDQKGRTSFPARFRDLLCERSGAAESASHRLILTTGIDPCLVAYTAADWAAFQTRLKSLPQFDPAIVQLKRLYVAGATECELDGHGRLLIPPMLREYAQLEREVVWAGMVGTIELWSKERWGSQLDLARTERAAIGHALGDLGL